MHGGGKGGGGARRLVGDRREAKLCVMERSGEWRVVFICSAMCVGDLLR